jgi:hypothetical protein
MSSQTQSQSLADILNDPDKRGAIFFNSTLIRDATSTYMVPVGSSWFYLRPGEYPEFGKEHCARAKSVLVLPLTSISWYRTPLYGGYSGTFQGASRESMYLGHVASPCPRSVQIATLLK